MDEIKKQIEEMYETFLYKYKKKMLNVSKKSADSLYENTLHNLKNEKDDYTNKTDKYSVYPNDDTRKIVYLNAIKIIFDNYKRQMRKYVDEKYINQRLAEEEPDQLEQDDKHILLREEGKIHIITDDQNLQKILEVASKTI